MVLVEDVPDELVVVREGVDDGGEAGDAGGDDELAVLQDELDGVLLQLRQEHLAGVLHQRHHQLQRRRHRRHYLLLVLVLNNLTPFISCSCRYVNESQTLNLVTFSVTSICAYECEDDCGSIR